MKADNGEEVVDYDSPWKEALDEYFPAFLEFFFSAVYDKVDWSRGFDSLDTELQQVVRDAELGRRRVDKLVRVWLKGGREVWILIHVEIQSQEETGFPRRMFVYHYRLFDKFDVEIVSLAVLADDRPNWRPSKFDYDHCGCRLTFEFPIAKLLDFAARAKKLETSSNPFAAVVLAHLKTQATRGDSESRREWKLRIVKCLYSLGLSGDDIRKRFRVIDWMMALPEDLELAFWSDVRVFEQEKTMPFVTIAERVGREDGLRLGLEQGLAQGHEQGLEQGRIQGEDIGKREGLLTGIESCLRLKFGQLGLAVLPEIRQLTAVDALRIVLTAIEDAADLDDVRRAIL